MTGERDAVSQNSGDRGTRRAVSGRRGALAARDIVLLGLMGAIMFVGKLAMAGLPNIEPVSLLIMVLVAVMGWRALFAVYVYVAMEFLTFGFGIWSVNYLYVWLVLVLLAMPMRKVRAPLPWAILSGAFGLAFGTLCTIPYLLVSGWAAALAYWISCIPFDIPHCIGNFVIALVLFRPCRDLLERLLKGR